MHSQYCPYTYTLLPDLHAGRSPHVYGDLSSVEIATSKHQAKYINIHTRIGRLHWGKVKVNMCDLSLNLTFSDSPSAPPTHLPHCLTTAPVSLIPSLSLYRHSPLANDRQETVNVVFAETPDSDVLLMWDRLCTVAIHKFVCRLCWSFEIFNT